MKIDLKELWEALGESGIDVLDSNVYVELKRYMGRTGPMTRVLARQLPHGKVVWLTIYPDGTYKLMEQ